MSKKRMTTNPLTESILSTIYTVEPNELNNNNNNDDIKNNNNKYAYDNTIMKNGKFNALPDIFTDVEINGTHGLTGHYYKDGLNRPYSLYDGKLVAGAREII